MIAPQQGVTTFWTAHAGDHVTDLVWSPDRRFLAAALAGGDLVVLRADTGEVIKQWAAHDFGATGICISGSTIASCGQDGAVRVWDANDWHLIHELSAPAHWAERIAYSPRGRLLGVAAGKTIRVWNASGSLINEWSKHASTVTDFGWKPVTKGDEAETLASICYGGVTLLRSGESKPARTLAWKGSSLRLQWSPNAKYIATGDQDSSVHLWIVKSGKDLMMTGYAIKVRELSWDSQSRFLATGGGTCITIWDCSGRGPEGSTPIDLDGHEGRLTALAFTHGSTTLASGDELGRVMWWDPQRETPLSQTTCDGDVTRIAWSPDDAVLAVATAAGEVSVCAAG